MIAEKFQKTAEVARKPGLVMAKTGLPFRQGEESQEEPITFTFQAFFAIQQISLLNKG
jgi:hypothetical protein